MSVILIDILTTPQAAVILDASLTDATEVVLLCLCVHTVLATLGAFNAFGCNVNAFFGGIASTSLHGWVWIICALIGSAVGIGLSPLFRLQNV
ncbi:MAG: YeeE/YedE thiosulfate transporter family protein [Rivularia sp. (in: cyanobacteria)]